MIKNFFPYLMETYLRKQDEVSQTEEDNQQLIFFNH
jgi:hypothetical protein